MVVTKDVGLVAYYSLILGIFQIMWIKSMKEATVALSNYHVYYSGGNMSHDDLKTARDKSSVLLHRLQRDVDTDNPSQRCSRYGWKFSGVGANGSTITTNYRKIFFGSLIADEPWELLEIVAGEARGIFEGMVFVESNRTQSFAPRKLKHYGYPNRVEKLQTLFQTKHVQIRHFTMQESYDDGLISENLQRGAILEGWKELGMTPEDIGYIADLDETFTRDLLRAVQTCDDIPFLQYHEHNCNDKAHIFGNTRIFESSPECATEGRSWFHPDMVVGACLEGIGNSLINPISPRENRVFRMEGYGKNGNFERITNGHYPLFNAADFRRSFGGTRVHWIQTQNESVNHERYMAYHFHNFFSDFDALRFKYKTYGHANADAYTSALEAIHVDIALMIACVKNSTNISKTIERKYVLGGFESLKPPAPLYFVADPQYRAYRHNSIKEQLRADGPLDE